VAPFSTPFDIIAAVVLAAIIWGVARHWLPRPGNDPSDEEMGYDPGARPPTEGDLEEPDERTEPTLHE
jgi:hypothetical protein